ncbi:MAG: metallophosphoesterase [Desulfovibrionaceae bacterium]
MRIAVLSDTHMHEPSAALIKAFERDMAHADVLIHCGDITEYAVWEFFDLHHPRFHAVAGNMCNWRLADDLPRMLDLDLDGLHVGVAHGWGSHGGVAYKVADAFGPGFQLILHGHTHVHTIRHAGDTLILNPGSFSSPREGAPGYAIVTHTPGKPLAIERIDL